MQHGSSVKDEAKKAFQKCLAKCVKKSNLCREQVMEVRNNDLDEKALDHSPAAAGARRERLRQEGHRPARQGGEGQGRRARGGPAGLLRRPRRRRPEEAEEEEEGQARGARGGGRPLEPHQLRRGAGLEVEREVVRPGSPTSRRRRRSRRRRKTRAPRRGRRRSPRPGPSRSRSPRPSRRRARSRSRRRSPRRRPRPTTTRTNARRSAARRRKRRRRAKTTTTSGTTEARHLEGTMQRHATQDSSSRWGSSRSPAEARGAAAARTTRAG